MSQPAECSIHHWRWLSSGQFEHASSMVAEIGRLVGGWLKQAAR